MNLNEKLFDELDKTLSFTSGKINEDFHLSEYLDLSVYVHLTRELFSSSIDIRWDYMKYIQIQTQKELK